MVSKHNKRSNHEEVDGVGRITTGVSWWVKGEVKRDRCFLGKHISYSELYTFEMFHILNYGH